MVIRSSGGSAGEVDVVVATNGSVDEGAGSVIAGCSDSCERWQIMEAAVAMGVGQVRVVENGLFMVLVVCGM